MNADITRRAGLAGAPAVAAAVALPATIADAAKGEDQKLLAAIAEFEPLFAEHERVWGAWCEGVEKSEAATDCPWRLATGPDDLPGLKEVTAHRERFGATNELYARANELDHELRGRADTIFAMPSATFDGIHAKFRFARLLETSLDLDSWQTWDAHDTWTEHVEHDLERLAGGAA